MKLKITSNFGLYKTTIVIYCYLERENDKLVKFNMIVSS